MSDALRCDEKEIGDGCFGFETGGSLRNGDGLARRAAVDICPRLLNDGIIFLGPPVDYQVANAVMAQLLHLRRKKSSFRSRRGA